MQNYSGDPSVSPHSELVDKCVDLLESSIDKTAGYALDFGVLEGLGATTLVERNDGFALGSYGFDRSLYTVLLLA